MKKLFSLLLFLPLFGLGQNKVTISPDNSAIAALQTAVGLKADIASPTFTGTPAAPTAAAGTSTTQLATTQFAYNEARQRALPRSYFDSIMGSNIKSVNISGLGMTSVVNATTLVNQRLVFSVTTLSRSDTITGAVCKQFVQGNYTGNNYNGFGVYGLVGGTWTLLASSTTDENLWSTTANGIVKKAFSSQVVLPRGVYVIAALWCRSSQSVAPTLGYIGTASATSGINDYTSGYKVSGYIDSQTSLPGTLNMSSATFLINQFWFELYK